MRRHRPHQPTPPEHHEKTEGTGLSIIGTLELRERPRDHQCTDCGSWCLVSLQRDDARAVDHQDGQYREGRSDTGAQAPDEAVSELPFDSGTVMTKLDAAMAHSGE